MSASIPMTEPHRRLCLEVAWEIDALARVLPGLVPCVADGPRGTDPHFVVRAMAGRLLRSSHVLMGVADNDDPDDMAQIINLDGGQG